MGEGHVVYHHRWREKNSKEVWCMSIPGVPSRREAYADTFNSLNLNHLEFFCKVYVPPFQLVTYDKLVDVLNQLKLLDRECSRLLIRIEERLLEVIPKGPKLFTAYSVGNKPLLEYLRVFAWDNRRYPADMTLECVTMRLVEDTADIQTQFNFFSSSRRDAVAALETFQRKTAGTVTTRDINAIIPDDSYVVESKNLTTLFVVVPRLLSKLWSETYEHISHLIVPGSSRLMSCDNDYDLFNLVIWRRGAESFREFISSETELSFRMFKFDHQEFHKSKGVEELLHTNEKLTTERLSSWLRINLRQVFLHTVHVKLLKVHVESLVRYGIPYRFQLVLVQPKKKKANKILEKFNTIFQNLEVKTNKLTKKSGSLDCNHKPFAFTKMYVTCMY